MEDKLFKNRLFANLLSAVLIIFFITGCDSSNAPKQDSTNQLNIVAGSESKEIEPIIQEFASDNNFTVKMTYKGSVDMMLDLQEPNFPYDAVLAANSIWIRMGDRDLHRVSDEASIMRSPVVLGVKKSLADELGWINKDVTVHDILNAVRNKKLQFAMTSATQSNSGASAYIGLLFGLAGKPDVLDSKHLADSKLQSDIKEIFGAMERGSGSSGWLNEMFISKYDNLNAMFNYESMVIALNKQLESQKKEPLYVIYPNDGLAIADSTIGFVNKTDNAANQQGSENKQNINDKKAVFIKLKDYLLSEKAQDKILKTGFRTGLIGMNPEKADKSVYNPEWGIDLKRSISPIPWPSADVIKEALSLYQTTLRKPSYTVYLLDVSGSMQGEGMTQLKQAMTGLLDQNSAEKYLLQTAAQDVIVVLTFNHGVVKGWKVDSSKPNDMKLLMDTINQLQPNGGTNIYLPVMNALDILSKEGDNIYKYLVSIILMTDGMSNDGKLSDIKDYFEKIKKQNSDFTLPPIFGVTFGSADDRQLKELAEFSTARVFDGRKDGLIKAFREAKGYN
ncbi:MAG: substrate-binding domain-containing protein [Desulfamplus sp.]|nr:substrate-binding domain-containing protein [Desulfamplus sp.]